MGGADRARSVGEPAVSGQLLQGEGTQGLPGGVAVFHQAGEEGPPEAVARAGGVHHGGVIGGLVGQAVAVGEGAAVGPQGHHHQGGAQGVKGLYPGGDALLAGEQGQLLLADLQHVAQGQAQLHPSHALLFRGPQHRPPVRVIGDELAHLAGFLHQGKGGGAAGVVGQGQGAEVQDGALLHLLHVHLFGQQLGVRAGVPVEGEAAVAVLVQLDKGQGGVVPFVHHQALGGNVVFLQALLQGEAKVILAHFADEPGGNPQPGQLHRCVGGGAAGVGAEHAGIAFDVYRGKVDEQLPSGQNLRHDTFVLPGMGFSVYFAAYTSTWACPWATATLV